jgi:RNA polymerase sigma-70 factor (ECF subfamily)
LRSDRELVEIVLSSGDEDAFRELYRRHTPRLYQLVLRILAGSEPDAEDVVQETWLRASQRISAFRWEAKLGTWLTAIGINLCRERLRKSGRFPTVELAPEIEPGLQVSSSGEWIDLERAIEVLPDGYRAVLLLHDVEGYTHEEIGEFLEIAVGTSKSQLSRARRTLRALLGSPSGGEHVPR